MKRIVLTAVVAALGFVVLSGARVQAEPPSRGGSGHHVPTADRHRDYRASDKFGYSKYGHKSYSWTHSYWSDYYHRYCYYATSYGWCFYEPTYSCYVPVSHYYDVYPDAVHAYSSALASSPTVTQQTTVVAAPAAPAVRPPEPPPIPVVAPPLAAVQNTKVGAVAP